MVHGGANRLPLALWRESIYGEETLHWRKFLSPNSPLMMLQSSEKINAHRYDPQTEIPKYECICSNGTAPANIEDYIGSVPNSICIATFEQCRRDNPGSEKCVKCGLLDAKDVPKAVVSSTIATPTATATDAADTAAAATASATGTNGADASAGNAAGVGGLAMGVMAALGLLL